MSTDETFEPHAGAPSSHGVDPTHDKLRQNIAARLTRLITSEEGLRAVVAAAAPKELIASTMEQVDATKTEAMALVGRELRTFLDHLDVGEELAKILTAVSFEIRLEVRFIPNEDGTLRANVRGGAKPKVKVEPRKKPWYWRATEEDAEDAEADLGATSDAGLGEDADPHAEAGGADLRSSSPGVRGGGAEGRERSVAGEGAPEEPEKRLRHRLGRRSLTSLVERVADAAATTVRAAAEVAADAAADVVNEARRGREGHDGRDDLDDY